MDLLPVPVTPGPPDSLEASDGSYCSHSEHQLLGTVTGCGVLHCDDSVIGEDDAVSEKPVLSSSLGGLRSLCSVIWKTV